MNAMLARTATAIACAAGLAFATQARAANVGYYEMCTGDGAPGQAAAISAAGHTPVNVVALDAPTLAGLRELFVTNCDNGRYAAAYVAGLPAIANAVNSGMSLVIHDRHVRGAASILPGGSAISFTGGVYGSNVDFPAGSPILTGPGGTLTDASLDGGNSSTHGFADVASLPAGGTALAFEASPSRLATITYRYGAGRVVYSTIPLDYYLAGRGPAEVSAAMRAVYAPNVIAWAIGFTTCAAEGYAGTKLSLCQKACESNLTGPALTGVIKMYVSLYKEQPACAR